MKIGFTSVDIPEGKIKYKDENLVALEMKDNPKKVTPFFAEFIRDEFIQSEAIIIPGSKILDLLVLDMEKIETRLTRITNNNEKILMAKCMQQLEKEIPLCDVVFNDEEKDIINKASFYSFKPVVKIENNVDVNTMITLAIEKASYMFFYTSGSAESHSWILKKGSSIVNAAAKIHTHLARGFIKGDVVSFDEYMSCHSFSECKSKGFSKVVDRDYIVQPKEIIEIRFNV